MSLMKKIRSFIGQIFFNLFRLDKAVESFLSKSALDVGIDVVVGNQVEGDYLEFRVFEGESFVYAFNRFKLHKSDEKIKRRFVAFDSFEGLPKSADELLPDQYIQGAYSATEKTFKSYIKHRGVPLTKVVTVKGFYDKTLNSKTIERIKLRKASVVYIDCDIYESARDVFNCLTNVVQTGTVIVIDDWFRHKGDSNHGIQKACNEWLNKNRHINLVELHKYRRIAFIVNVSGGRK